MNYCAAVTRILLLSLAGISSALGQTIVSVSPTFGQAGTYVTISGNSFLSTTVVRFGDTIATARLTGTSGGLEQIQAAVPAGLTDPVVISVQNPGGDPFYSPSWFTNITAGPFISSFSPASGNAGTTVTINGANFSGTTSVKFGSISASFTPVTVVNRITVTAPAGVLTGPITVTTPKGSYTSGANFYAPPSVTSFTPTNGVVGTSVKITGKNLTGASQVSFGNVPATSFVVTDNTQINAVVPEGVTNGIITVTGGGTMAFTSTKFAVLPTLNAFSPAVGQAGTQVTITGLSLNPGSPKVSFGGASPVSPSSASYNQIIVVTPPQAVSGPITVTTGNGTAVTTENYLMPPQVSSFSPSSGRPGTIVDIKGGNFTNVSSVSFHGANAAFTVINNGLIRATVPPDANSGQITVINLAASVKSTPNFLVPPLITGFSPLSGVSGTHVTISGSFPDVVTNVLFNLGRATIENTSTNSVHVIVPPTASTGPITVFAMGGTNSSALAFTMDVWLSISNANNRVVSLSWPTNAVGFSLQYRSNTTSATWTPLTNGPIRVVGEQNVFTNTLQEPERYYRLKK